MILRCHLSTKCEVKSTCYLYPVQASKTPTTKILKVNCKARWRVCSSAARWIRRASPGAWRTESHTLTTYPSLLPYDILSYYPNPSGILPKSGRCVSATAPWKQPEAAGTSGCRGFWIPKTLPRRLQEAFFYIIFQMPCGIEF